MRSAANEQEERRMTVWILEFLAGIVTVWLLLSKGFWRFIFRFIFGRKHHVFKQDELEEEEPEEIKPEVKSAKDDLSKMPREELAELLRNEEVRVVKK
jgi:hypothetical protein